MNDKCGINIVNSINSTIYYQAISQSSLKIMTILSLQAYNSPRSSSWDCSE